MAAAVLHAPASAGWADPGLPVLLHSAAAATASRRMETTALAVVGTEGEGRRRGGERLLG